MHLLVISVLSSTKKSLGWAALNDLWAQISSSQGGDLCSLVEDAREETESTQQFVIYVVSTKGAPTADREEIPRACDSFSFLQN